jgi:hypothetical protein
MNPSLRPLLGLAAYVVLLALAWIQGWHPGNLVWGLWISGFVMVGIWLVVMSGLLVLETRFDPLKTGGLLVGMAALAGGLVWLYDFYGEMLELAFPLAIDSGREFTTGGTEPNERTFPFWPSAAFAARHYFFVIVLTLLPLLTGFRRSQLQADRFRHTPEFNGASFARLHLTILALAGLQIAFRDDPTAHTFWFSAAVLTINFFPWELLDKRKFAEFRSLASS